MRHRETEPGGRGWESRDREGRACEQVAKADTLAGKCNRGKERRSLSGVKAVARRDRLAEKRTRANHVLAVAREKEQAIRGNPK